LFGDTSPPAVATAAAPSTRAPDGEPREASREATDERLREALRHYNQALERLKAGDWVGFGSALEALRAALEGR
jgi:uncharacterized protein